MCMHNTICSTFVAHFSALTLVTVVRCPMQALGCTVLLIHLFSWVGCKTLPQSVSHQWLGKWMAGGHHACNNLLQLSQRLSLGTWPDPPGCNSRKGIQLQRQKIVLAPVNSFCFASLWYVVLSTQWFSGTTGNVDVIVLTLVLVYFHTMLASAGNSYHRLSIRLSQVGVLLKQLNVGSCKQCCKIAQRH